MFVGKANKWACLLDCLSKLRYKSILLAKIRKIQKFAAYSPETLISIESLSSWMPIAYTKSFSSNLNVHLFHPPKCKRWKIKIQTQIALCRMIFIDYVISILSLFLKNDFLFGLTPLHKQWTILFSFNVRLRCSKLSVCVCVCVRFFMLIINTFYFNLLFCSFCCCCLFGVQFFNINFSPIALCTRVETMQQLYVSHLALCKLKLQSFLFLLLFVLILFSFFSMHHIAYCASRLHDFYCLFSPCRFVLLFCLYIHISVSLSLFGQYKQISCTEDAC